MAKKKTAFVCSECGAEFARWQGQCSECRSWNTITEFRMPSVKSTISQGATAGYAGFTQAKIQTLNEVNLTELPRFTTGFSEFDRVLGVVSFPAVQF